MVRSKILDKIEKDNNESLSSSEEYEKSRDIFKFKKI